MTQPGIGGNIRRNKGLAIDHMYIQVDSEILLIDEKVIA